MNIEQISFDSKTKLTNEIISTPRSRDSSIIINNFESFSEEEKENKTQISKLEIELSNIAKENVKAKIKNFRDSFDNSREDELSKSLIKTYTQMNISPSQTFLARMKNDLQRREERIKQIDKFVEEQKMQLSEKDKIKSLNYLLLESNTKALAKEQLIYMKEIINKQIISTDAIKSKKEFQWYDSYTDQFKKYQEDKGAKITKKKGNTKRTKQGKRNQATNRVIRSIS